MYAIVRTGGKQYRVEPGRPVAVERLPGEEGATVELGDVLLIADDGQVTVGTPMIEGARVMAQVESQGRARKVIVFKYKAKVRTRKKTGHRQAFTRLAVKEILRPGEKSTLEKEKPKARRRRKVEEAPQELPVAEAETPAAEAPEVAPEVEPAPKRRTRRKAPAGEPATPVAEAAAAEAEAPKPRTRRKATAKVEEPPAAEGEAKPARRRTPRRKTDKETE